MPQPVYTVFLLLFSFVFSVALLHLFRLAFYEQARRALRMGSAPAFSAHGLRVLGASLLGGATVAGLVTRSPIAGLIVLVMVSALVPLFARFRASAARSQLDDSGLAYLHALRGLVHSGLGLSAAFFRLAEAQRTPFSTAMARSLDAFDDGKTLAACLEHLHRRVDSPLMGATLRNLQTAYRQGLPVGAILDQMVPALEAHRDGERRAADLRRSAWAQAGIAFGVPWVLVAASVACRPEGGAAWLGTPWGCGLAAAALLVEGVGLWLIGQCSRFF